MSVSQFTEFRNKVNADSGLQQKIKSGANLADLAKSNGYNISQAEMKSGLAELDKEDSDLSDFELEMVSGAGNKPFGHADNTDRTIG